MCVIPRSIYLVREWRDQHAAAAQPRNPGAGRATSLRRRVPPALPGPPARRPGRPQRPDLGGRTSQAGGPAAARAGRPRRRGPDTRGGQSRARPRFQGTNDPDFRPQWPSKLKIIAGQSSGRDVFARLRIATCRWSLLIVSACRTRSASVGNLFRCARV